MPDPTTLLAEHRFAELFREELGWDRASGNLTIEVDQGRRFTFDAVAQKRGFQILQCNVDRPVICNRGLLRRAQREVARSAHEHILIYYCDTPAKQVWQWAVRDDGGRRFLHREHPFFSCAPPPPLLDRMAGLRFTLRDEDDGVTLVDALRRVRAALDAPPDRKLFVKRPGRAERGDALAVAMRNGDQEAFHQFVELHLPLARRLTKRLQHLHGADPDDAEQIAVLGLIQAARRFNPELGFRFSTYAYYAIRQEILRRGPESALLIRLPEHLIAPLFQTRRRLDRLHAAEGPGRVNDELARLCAKDPSLARLWSSFERCLNVCSLSNGPEPERLAAMVFDDEIDEQPLVRLLLAERTQRIEDALNRLTGRPSQVLRMRFGIDGEPPRSLAEIGRVLGVTRERVRQLQNLALQRLRTIIQGGFKDLLPSN